MGGGGHDEVAEMEGDRGGGRYGEYLSGRYGFLEEVTFVAILAILVVASLRCRGRAVSLLRVFYSEKLSGQAARLARVDTLGSLGTSGTFDDGDDPHLQLEKPFPLPLPSHGLLAQFNPYSAFDAPVSCSFLRKPLDASVSSLILFLALTKYKLQDFTGELIGHDAARMAREQEDCINAVFEHIGRAPKLYDL